MPTLPPPGSLQPASPLHPGSPPAPGAAEVPRTSRLDVMRLACEAAINAWHNATPQNEPQRLLAVRAVQEHISKIKHRNPAAASRASPLAWADDWNPPAR